MNRMIAVAALAVLAGCQSKAVTEMSYTEQRSWAAGIVQSCKDQKVPDREMQACINAESMRDAAARHNNGARRSALGAALASGMSGMGASMQSSAATYRPPVNCTSRLAGTNVGQPNRIETSCY